MTSLGGKEKTARNAALTTARAALKGLGASEVTSAGSVKHTTAKKGLGKTGGPKGVSVRKRRLRS